MTDKSMTDSEIEQFVGQIDDSTTMLRLPDVEKIVGFKSTHIYNMINAGQFPAPIKLGRRHVVWLSTQITSWKKDAVRRALAT